MLKKFGSRGIFVDGTHNVTQYESRLVTVGVVDNRGCGYPVAWGLVKGESQENIQPIFEKLKELYGGPIATDYFMSDKAEAYWNAWRAAMGEEACAKTTRQLCHWHLWRCWVKNMAHLNPELRKIVMAALYTMAKTPKPSECTKAKHEMIAALEADGDGKVFLEKYLQVYYLDSGPGGSKERTWVGWLRVGCPSNVNMFIERMNRTFKYKFLNRLTRSRVDTLIFKMLECARWYRQEYSLQQSKRYIAGSRGFESNRSHKKTLKYYSAHPELVEELTSEEGPVWRVQSESNPVTSYHIIRKCEKCPIDDCLERCTYRPCLACPHEFSCECLDSLIADAACKHIHAVQTKFQVFERVRVVGEVAPRQESHDASEGNVQEPEQSTAQQDGNDTDWKNLKQMHAALGAFIAHRECHSEDLAGALELAKPLNDFISSAAKRRPLKPPNRFEKRRVVKRQARKFDQLNNHSKRAKTEQRANREKRNNFLKQLRRSKPTSKWPERVQNRAEGMEMLKSQTIVTCYYCQQHRGDKEWVACSCNLHIHRKCIEYLTGNDRQCPMCDNPC